MLRFERGIAHGVAVYAAVVLTVFAAAFLLAALLAAPLERTFLIAFGVFVLAGAYVKPWWFWEHVDGWLLRSLLGDRAALMVFVLTGLALVYVGVFADLPGSR